MTQADYAEAVAALNHRPATALAAFIASLFSDHETGVGDYARAFAASDSIQAAQIIKQSISAWAAHFHHDSYHQAAAAAQRVEWVLEAIERCVSPTDPDRALALIIRCFQEDRHLRQDDLDHISDAFRQAAILFWRVGQRCSAEQLQIALGGLSGRDYTGYRSWLDDSSRSITERD